MGVVINTEVLMSQQNGPMSCRKTAFTWPFSLASLNKERQGKPARRTVSEPDFLVHWRLLFGKMAQAPIGFLAQHFAAFWIWPAAHNGSLKIGAQNTGGARGAIYFCAAPTAMLQPEHSRSAAMNLGWCSGSGRNCLPDFVLIDLASWNKLSLYAIFTLKI